jgi:hypothetical protein
MTTGMCEPSKYAIDFFNKMPQELKKSTKINYNDLLLNHQYLVASVFFDFGRKNLTESKWGEAKKNFEEAIDKGSLSTKTKAILGLICSLCRVDLEWAAMILNRPRLKDIDLYNR